MLHVVQPLDLGLVELRALFQAGNPLLDRFTKSRTNLETFLKRGLARHANTSVHQKHLRLANFVARSLKFSLSLPILTKAQNSY